MVIFLSIIWMLTTYTVYSALQNGANKVGSKARLRMFSNRFNHRSSVFKTLLICLWPSYDPKGMFLHSFLFHHWPKKIVTNWPTLVIFAISAYSKQTINQINVILHGNKIKTGVRNNNEKSLQCSKHLKLHSNISTSQWIVNFHCYLKPCKDTYLRF